MEDFKDELAYNLMLVIKNPNEYGSSVKEAVSKFMSEWSGASEEFYTTCYMSGLLKRKIMPDLMRFYPTCSAQMWIDYNHEKEMAKLMNKKYTDDEVEFRAMCSAIIGIPCGKFDACGNRVKE